MSQGQVPAVISVGLISFVLGAGLGAFGMFWWKFDAKNAAFGIGPDQEARADGKGGGPPGGGKGGGPPGMGGMGGKGGGGGKMGKGGGGPAGGMGTSPKASLASLVTTLDALTAKPLEIKLSDEQKSKLAKLLKELDPDEDMSDDDATKRLDEMLKIVEGNKAALEAAGFRWPGSAPPMMRPFDGNPFADGANKEHLKQLSDRVKQK